MPGPPKSVTIRVPCSPAFRDAITEAARQDEQTVVAWLRIVAVAVLRKRGMWPPGGPGPAQPSAPPPEG